MHCSTGDNVEKSSVIWIIITLCAQYSCSVSHGVAVLPQSMCRILKIAPSTVSQSDDISEMHTMHASNAEYSENIMARTRQRLLPVHESVFISVYESVRAKKTWSVVGRG